MKKVSFFTFYISLFLLFFTLLPSYKIKAAPITTDPFSTNTSTETPTPSTPTNLLAPGPDITGTPAAEGLVENPKTNVSELIPIGLSGSSGQTKKQGGGYQLLAPLDQEKTADVSGNLLSYVETIFKFTLGIAGVLAVIMIVIGGIQYISTDAIYGKKEGKERITQAILGLLLAFVAWLILYEINPDLLKFNINLSLLSAFTLG